MQDTNFERAKTFTEKAAPIVKEIGNAVEQLKALPEYLMIGNSTILVFFNDASIAINHSTVNPDIKFENAVMKAIEGAKRKGRL